MPQTPMYKGFEACYVNMLIVFRDYPFLAEQIRCCPLIHFRTRNEGLKEFCRMKGDVSQQVDEEMNH
jgi:hypothetical protein